MNKLEIIAWSLQDAIDIEKSGAHRIELVADLERGGLTPSFELVKEISENINIPVRVMIRCTDESFVYNEEQMEEHINFINKIKDLNIEGIVFGSLTNEGNIDFNQLEQVIEAKGNMKLAFHRAFDELKENAIEEFDKLSNYDVDTLLTSGTKSSAIEGKEIIKELVDKKTINILPGKSISIDNAKDIIDFTGADFIHVGYSVRDVENTEGKIDFNKVQRILESINN